MLLCSNSGEYIGLSSAIIPHLQQKRRLQELARSMSTHKGQYSVPHSVDNEIFHFNLSVPAMMTIVLRLSL